MYCIRCNVFSYSLTEIQFNCVIAWNLLPLPFPLSFPFLFPFSVGSDGPASAGSSGAASLAASSNARLEFLSNSSESSVSSATSKDLILLLVWSPDGPASAVSYGLSSADPASHSSLAASARLAFLATFSEGGHIIIFRNHVVIYRCYLSWPLLINLLFQSRHIERYYFF